MKKILFTLAVVFAMITVAKADSTSYLYWMIDGSDGRFSSLEYTGLSFNVKTASGYESIMFYDEIGGATGYSSLTKDEVKLIAGNATLFADVTDYDLNAVTFYIELFNDSTQVAYSEIPSAQVASYIASFDPANPSGFRPANKTWSAPAPEPTSGLLMLLGMAALGLKRRKMTNA